MVGRHDLTKKKLKVEGTSFSTSQFMSNLTDDLLSEILIRLPKCRDAIQCRSVCRRWNLLISSPQFIRSFIHHQSLVSDSHLSILLFQNIRSWDRSMPYNFQLCKRFPEKSNFLENFLNFLPCDDVIIRASFDDLLLVSKRSNSRNLYICNLLTRKWHALPQAPRGITKFYIKCGLVCLPNNGHYTCKVALFGYDYPDPRPPVVTLFCSETAQWSELVDFQLPPPLKSWIKIHPLELSRNQLVACNGILYWVESSDTVYWEGVVAFDPFTDAAEKQCRFIGLPIDIDPTPLDNKLDYICLGTFERRLRLSRICKVGKDIGLKIWELRENDHNAETSWSLVHNVALEIGVPRMIYPLALHPSDGNVVFLSRDNWFTRNDELLQYDILKGKYQKLEFPAKHLSPGSGLYVFLLTSPWPTPVPALPL